MPGSVATHCSTVWKAITSKLVDQTVQMV
jgi:hypothetical protein